MAPRLYSTTATALHLISLFTCLIVLASFTYFAADQMGDASRHQLAELGSAPSIGPAVSGAPSPHHGAVRTAIDGAANALTSPFTSLTEGSSNVWVVHGGTTLAALIIFGAGLGFAGRSLRVRG